MLSKHNISTIRDVRFGGMVENSVLPTLFAFSFRTLLIMLMFNTSET